MIWAYIALAVVVLAAISTPWGMFARATGKISDLKDKLAEIRLRGQELLHSLEASEADRDRVEAKLRELAESSEEDRDVLRGQIARQAKELEDARKRLRARASRGDGLAFLRELSEGEKTADDGSEAADPDHSDGSGVR